ncbi:CapA family protein [Clostridium paraputrificum]|uniref:CapA family protein n=2 Tax=Clostridiaceae TaxID=31979 RepID=UPI001A9B6914|nr:CapA family protein [Clostridium paraputrificum]MDC0801309.1 CapA family protein [Clostridium paraputrificum]
MKIAFLGDIGIFPWGLIGTDWKNNLYEIKKKLMEYDLVVANLETPITNLNRTIECKGIHLKSDSNVIDILKYLNIKVVNLANNHICDYGLRGMQDTIDILEQNNIKYFGINNKSLKMEVCGERISFHGFSCFSTNGTRYINLKQNRNGVCSLNKKDVETVLFKDLNEDYYSILSFHWGDEYSNLPNQKQVDFMHELALKYKFIVHGHHAHVMQGIESVKNNLIAYNLGNFCFDECRSQVNSKLKIKQTEENQESYILSVEIMDKQIFTWSTEGIKYKNNRIIPNNNNEKINYLSNLIKDCDKEWYKEESQKLISKQRCNNCAKHNFKWLISKMNYYSIGALILSYINDFKYKKSF